MSISPFIGDNPSSHQLNNSERVIQSNEVREIDPADKWLLIALIVLFTLLFVFTPEAPTEWEMDSLVFILGVAISNESRVILIWNPPSIPIDYDGLSHDCGCTITTNQSLIDKARFVIFHWPTLDRLPIIKRPNQLWIWINTLEQFNSDGKNFHESILNVQQKYFDCWSTCRSDSDFIISPLLQWYSPSFQLSGQTINLRNNRKTRDIIWFKNCATDSQFDSFVSSLKQFITIDIYTKSDLESYTQPKWSLFTSKILPTYKFILLTDENSYCTNSITRTVLINNTINLIPLIARGININFNILPEQFYIDSNQFSSNKLLADHLKSFNISTVTNKKTKWTFKQFHQLNINNYNKFLNQVCLSLQSTDGLEDICKHGEHQLINWFYNQDNCDSIDDY